MVNKSLFSTPSFNLPHANTANEAGGIAYSMTNEHALAQIACTNCFNGVFYASADSNLELTKKIVSALKNNPEFIAKTAIYCREKANMKDMPAYLTAVLAGLDSKLFRKVFPRVIDNGKMLRNFIQIGRSGQAGKVLNMSSGAVRNAIQEWFNNRSAETIFKNSIGNDPSMRDILRMVHVKPNSDEKAALFAYLSGATREGNEYVVKYKKEVVYRHNFSNLPEIVQSYENFKSNPVGEIPAVDFRLLDSFLNKDQLHKVWRNQAEVGGWHSLRMNLNNFNKYEVFRDSEMVNLVANKLKDENLVKNSKAFPYQLLTTYRSIGADTPFAVREAIQDAMEIATENTPVLEGKVYVCLDVSGSMGSPVTGYRGSVTTNTSCLDVAALIAACVLRNNKEAEVIPFDNKIRSVELNPRDTVLTNAKKLCINGGATDCACALKHLNDKKAHGDLVIFVSDYESWAGNHSSKHTAMLEQWKLFKKHNKNAKLVCIDLTPRITHQVNEHKEILHVGGFSDSVFEVIAKFVESGNSSDNYWVDVINSIEV